MSEDLKFQVRISLCEEFAKAARHDPYNEVLEPLAAILRKHKAKLDCQFDEFRRYVEAAEAHGEADTPLTAWTREVINDPAKIEKYTKVFTVSIGGENLFAQEKANEIMRDFQPLKDQGIVTRIIRPSNDPAQNPQPPARFHKG